MLAQQQLVGLIVTALQAEPAVAPLVARQRVRPVGLDVSSAVVVRLMRSQCANNFLGGQGPLDWSATLALECVVRTGATQAPDEAVGPLLQAVHARLLADPALVGAGYRLEPEILIDWDQDEVDERIGSATLVISVRWRAFPS